jgi:hypothetical protein
MRNKAKVRLRLEGVPINSTIKLDIEENFLSRIINFILGRRLRIVSIERYDYKERIYLTSHVSAEPE